MVKYKLFCSASKSGRCRQCKNSQHLPCPGPWVSPTSVLAFNHLLQHHFNQRGIMLMWFPAGAFLSISPRDKEQNRAKRHHRVGK